MMSGSSSSGAPPTGVVKNSALSFVTSAQPMQTPSVSGVLDENSREEINQTDRLVPAGLKALYEAWSSVYPDQPNPLQVTTRLKYWLGGQDPLDYISMYWNPGKQEENIPPHWHYVSFGLSDLHGDGRVHGPPVSGQPSGSGAELTLRLGAAPGAPPLWPAALLQALARYVLTTGNKFCAGDHITWHRALDGGTESRVRHLLVAEDPQLASVNTPHGTVNMLQMVGCTGRELRAAQRGSGFEVLEIIGKDPNCGGPWLVTKVRRRSSARGLCSRARPAPPGPSPLAGVTARLRWLPCPPEVQGPAPTPLAPSVEQQIKDTLQRGLTTMSSERTGPHGHMSTDSFEMSSIERALPHVPEAMQCSWRGEDTIEYFEGVHLMLNPEGASLLPLAIDGRVSLGSHFTWRCGPLAVSVLPPSVAGALGSLHRPYAARGDWLQIIIPRELALEMSPQISALAQLADTDSESEGEESAPPLPPPPTVPFSLSWPRFKLKISVLHDHEFL